MPKDIREKLLPYIEDPESYKEEYLNWLHTEKPTYEKDNPNNIPVFKMFQTEDEAVEYLRAKGIEPDEKAIKRFMLTGSCERNPEYDALPEKQRDESEWLYMEEAKCYDIRVLENGDLDFAVDLDNFEFLPYLEFAYEQVTGEKFSHIYESQNADPDFLDEFIEDLGNTYIFYEKDGKRFSLPKIN